MAVTASALAALPGDSRVYIDTNVWIYALEGFAPFALSLTALFRRIDDGELVGITSALTVAEAMVKPFAAGNAALQRTYLEALQDRPQLILVPISRAILIEAARMRATHPALKLPDAIHAASALAQGATAFLTNDMRFASVLGTRTMVLEPD
jgi:predicted nucleic acid-binding protein